MDTVLFACVHNAGRSQMAAAIFNQVADPSKARAISAGTEPGATIHPEVVAVMREMSVDLSQALTTKLTTELAASATWLITMGCGEQCPVIPGIQREDWPVEDPKGRPIAAVRAIRDDIGQRVAEFVRRRAWLREASNGVVNGD